MQLLVLGMHRSGTSVVTRLLNMAGAYFGPEGIATDANDENPKGFWERRDLRASCDALLHGAGADWWRVSTFDPVAVPAEVLDEELPKLRRLVLELDAHRPWVLKEPRLCLLLPILRPLLEVPIAVQVTRDPLEVARSLAARNGYPVAFGIALWEAYTVASVRGAAGMPTVTVSHRDLMADPEATFGRLLDDLAALGVDGLRRPDASEIEAFVARDLHRQHGGAEEHDGWLNGQQRRLLDALESGVEHVDTSDLGISAAALEALVAHETRAEEAEALAARLEDRGDALRAELDLERGRHERDRRRLEARGDRFRDELAHERARLQRQTERSSARDAERRERIAQLEEQVAAERVAERERVERVRQADDALRRSERELRMLRDGRLWQLSRRLTRLKGQLTRHPVKGAGPARRGLDIIGKARATLRADVRRAEPAAGKATVATAGAATSIEALPSPSPRRTDRPKVAVLAWDVGHNPLGRAYIMAGLLERHLEVEIWGAQFERYGSAVWAPMRDGSIPVHVFPGLEFPDHLEMMQHVAERIDADLLWVAKPRFPSYGLGIMAKAFRNRPMVLDVDDHELAFFDEDTGIDLASLETHRGDPDLVLPFGRTWTRACDPLIGDADAVTVSNVALQQRYGGTIVTHARDETVFDPGLVDRRRVRAELGFDDDHRLLLFGGTPRVHKGAIEVLQALDRLGDDRYRVLMFGTRELDDLKAELEPLRRWIAPLPYTPFSQLPSLVAAADLSCVLQDPSHPVVRYQLPAKISDALAMEVPCLVRPVPPLRPLVDAGVVEVLDLETPLHERIHELFSDRASMHATAARGRAWFLANASYGAVGPVVAAQFEELLSAPPAPVTPSLRALVDAPRRLVVSTAGGKGKAAALPVPRRPGQHRRPLGSDETYDVVMFWKQNDSSIYGRRQDMFLEYLRRSPRVGTIVHFDSPISPEAMLKTYRSGRGNPSDQSTFVVRQTMARLLRRRDEVGIVRRTYLHSGARTAKLGLPARSGYETFVRDTMRQAGLGLRRTVFWTYPTNDDLPRLIDAFDPDLVVADVVDDNRSWYEPGEAGYDRVEKNYVEVLSRSDLVLANCVPVAEAMARFAPDVHVIPNGCELPDGSPRGVRPPELASLLGPIVGYVGNLSSRIDIPLLESLARARPDWNFVFIGSAHLDRSILALEAFPNVSFLGVKPYAQTQRLVRHFDVALIPHLDNEMTRAMNPLKAFVYASAGVPVVSTPIANLDELSSVITQAKGVDEFLQAIEHALLHGPSQPDLEVLGPHAWTERVERALDLVDEALGGRTSG